jgi:Tfp pilus assembly protein PilF
MLAGCAELTVPRVVDGQVIEGRFVSEHAYAFYARAAEAEAAGDRRAALAAYAAAIEEDPESPEIWTRVGALRCASVETRAGADSAFERAAELDPESGPLALEEARCALARGDVALALARAERALALDPDADEVSLFLASALSAAARPADARRVLEALVVRLPASTVALRELTAAADRAGDRPAALRAARLLRELAPDTTATLEQRFPELRPLAEVDAALALGDLAAARRRARAAALAPADLAARAAALGRAEMARDQAALVAAADPSDATAAIALATAADLLGDEGGLARALDAAPRAGIPSPLARWLYADLLLRRVSADAARALLEPLEPPAGDDPLLARLAGRVRAELDAADAPRADAR